MLIQLVSSPLQLRKGITQATVYTNPLFSKCLNNSSSINRGLECPKLVAKVLKQAVLRELMASAVLRAQLQLSYYITQQ
jgi:hypothetical protein